MPASTYISIHRVDFNCDVAEAISIPRDGEETVVCLFLKADNFSEICIYFKDRDELLRFSSAISLACTAIKGERTS